MNHATFQLRSGTAPRCATLVLLVLLVFQETAAAGGSPSPAVCMLQSRTPAAAVFAQGWTFGRFWDLVERGLGERRRMIQFATIGLIVGLFILMKK